MSKDIKDILTELRSLAGIMGTAKNHFKEEAEKFEGSDRGIRTEHCMTAVSMAYGASEKLLADVYNRLVIKYKI